MLIPMQKVRVQSPEECLRLRIFSRRFSKHINNLGSLQPPEAETAHYGLNSAVARAQGWDACGLTLYASITKI